MYVVCVNVKVTAGRAEEFVQATALNHAGSVQEPGCLRFDVLQSEEAPDQFFLYEVYRSREAFAAHQKTDHYHTWRDTVADWMAEKRVGVKFHSIYPTDDRF